MSTNLTIINKMQIEKEPKKKPKKVCKSAIRLVHL